MADAGDATAAPAGGWKRTEADTADTCREQGNAFFKEASALELARNAESAGGKEERELGADELEQYSLANKCYTEALKMLLRKDDPEVRPKCHLNRAACRLKLGEFEGAFADCSVVLLAYDENSWKALYRRGMACLRMSRFEEAKEDLMHAASVHQDKKVRSALAEAKQSFQAEQDMHGRQLTPRCPEAPIGPRGWLTPVLPPGAVIISEDPLAYYINKFATDDECAELIGVGAPKMKRAVVSGDKKGYLSSIRTNSVAWCAAVGNPVLEGLEDRILGLFDAQAERTENFQVIHYEETQEYKPHLDAYDIYTVRGQRTTSGSYGGQRLITALLYLCDVEAGGSTAFTKLGKECFPEKGRLLVFYDCQPGCTVPDPNCLHCGSPVDKGIKWAANKWFRQRELRGRQSRFTDRPAEETDEWFRLREERRAREAAAEVEE